VLAGKTLPGMTLTAIKNTGSGLQKTLTECPEIKTSSNDSYIRTLSTHSIKVYYGTNIETLTADEILIKLDHNDASFDDSLKNKKYLVCEIGAYDADGNVIEDDYPGLVSTVNDNIVTNYITTLGSNTKKATSIYIKYTYYVEGESVANAKVELIRHEGSTTYFMTVDNSSIMAAADGSPGTTEINATASKLTAGDVNATSFNG
jgi:hypothetical protein